MSSYGTTSQNIEMFCFCRRCKRLGVYHCHWMPFIKRGNAVKSLLLRDFDPPPGVTVVKGD